MSRSVQSSKLASSDITTYLLLLSPRPTLCYPNPILTLPEITLSKNLKLAIFTNIPMTFESLVPKPLSLSKKTIENPTTLKPSLHTTPLPMCIPCSTRSVPKRHVSTVTRPHLSLRHGTIDDLAHLASAPTISPSAIAPAGNRTRDLALIPISKRHVSIETRPHLSLRHETIDDLAHLTSVSTNL
ncbi:hypothetical protein Fmac_011078 [Flemingia macrophylla]|uniref:Uncharacterized protein n=1 Tax=Flemingia macrophylla TaxID=520843 RepID=A0ABD1MM79_9FABA